MGGFLSQIQGRSVAVDCALLNSTHSKLIEYYSSYKSICEGFTISIPEYTQIFGASQLSFAVWDSRGRGKIDAIQMFAGLVVFSRIRYEQKIKFLFQIFDFNEQGYLYYENLAFLLLNVCNATYKLLALPRLLPQSAIQTFLDDYFTHDSKIHLPQLLRWTKKNRNFLEYFHEIGYQVEQPPEDRRIDHYSAQQGRARKLKNARVYTADKDFRLDNKFVSSLQSLLDRRQVADEQMMNIQLQWLYGIEVGRENIRFVRVQRQKAGNERIIYSVGKMVVVYFPKLNAQRYYKGHTQPISVIEISKLNRLAASAQSGQYPDIHIWDIQTRLNLIKFKRIHKYSITFLKFFRNDRFLITASQSLKYGGSIQSPVVILKLDTKQVIMSTYLKLQITGIATFMNHSEKQTSGLVVSKSSITILSQNDRAFNVQRLDLRGENTDFKDIIAFTFHPRGNMITAHAGRQLCKWDQKFNCLPLKYQPLSNRQILQIAIIGQDLLLIMDQLDIELVSIRIQQPTQLKRKRMLGLFQSKIYNMSLSSMQVVEGNKLLVVSQFGDVIKISEIETRQIRFQKYYQLFKMEQVSDVFFPNNSSILFVSSRFLYVVDRYQKELKILSKYDFQMKVCDVHKESLVTFATFQNKYSNISLISLSQYTIRQSFKINYNIQDIKITQNHVLALTENVLYVFHRNHDKYFQKQPGVHKLTFGKCLTLIKETEQRSFLIITQLKQIIKLVLNGTNQIDFQKIDKQENLYQKLSLYYPQQNYKYPFIVCPNRRIVALGRKNGDILLWESLSSALTNFSSYTLLSLHSDKVTSLMLTDNQLFSVGSQDGLVAEFIHKEYMQVAEEKDLIEEEQQQNQMKKTITKTIWKESDHKKVISFKQLQGNGLRQGQIEILGLTESDNLQLKSIINQIISPSDKVNYQSQLKEGLDYQRLVLEMDSVYGINTNSKSIFYVHSYPSQGSITKKNLDQKYWQDPSSLSNKDQLQFAKNTLIPLDEDHNSCKRQILYCADRFCVLNEKNAPQQLYKFHRRKISVIAVHPNKQLICSCQVSSSFAQLHLWRHQERTTFISLITKHRSIITRAQFSRDGQWIVTLGGSERSQSIQIFNWQNEQTIAFRLVQDQLINEVVFNPYEKRQLCFAGLGIIRIYRVQQQLIIKQQCKVPQQNFQALAYTSNVYGSDIESDVITGSSQGDIGLYVCGSFLYSHKKAHDKGINVLRLVELFQYKRVLVSGGGDGYVRIWDIKFNAISSKNVRDELYSIKNTSMEMPETIIVSIDIYQCLRKQSGQSNGSALMLIGTSDGSVLEATITNQFQGYKAVSLINAESQCLKEKINFDISLSFTAPPSQHNFNSQTCKNLLITYSRKSKFVYFWNMNFRTRQKIFPLSSPPLFVRKMNTKSVLLIGTQQNSDYHMRLYDLEWSAGVYLRSINLIGQIQLQKGNFIPNGAYFSQNDNNLAVKMKFEEVEEVWIYERGLSSSQGIQYMIRARIQQKNPLAFMRIEWCQFTARQEGIMVAWSQSKQDSHADAQIKYKCYDCSTGGTVALGFYQIQKFDFSAKVKATYIPCFQLTGQTQKDYSIKDSINMTIMAQHNKFLLIGTSSGQILIIQSQFFARKDNDSKYFARCYVVGDSPINMIEVRQGDVIVSCKSGQAAFIMKWKIQRGWGKKQICKDEFSESIGPEQLQKKLKQTFQKRKKIQSETELVNINCGIDLKLSAVIGRSAFYKRNNIFIDLKDNIISFSGCNLLSMKHQNQQRLSQRIIKPDLSTSSNHPQISCIILGDCKRFLLIGTSQENAKIIAWDISTNTNLFDIKLNGFIMINLLKLSFSNKHSIVLATAKNGHQYLLFIDLINKAVLAVHHFHRNIQINDLCFVLGYQFRVLACGVKYMAEWSYCNNLLIEKSFNFGNGQQSEEIKTDVIFYSLIFIYQYAISSGSDGYLYVWKDQKIVKRQNAHPKESILSLYTSINSKIFVSGANNGTVIIWNFSSSLIIQKQAQISIYTGKQLKVPLKYQVQSICMAKRSLIVGNRAGEIIHFPFQDGNQKGDQGIFTITNKTPLPILSSFNHQIIRSCAFNTSSKKLYVMTEAQAFSGTFSVFDIQTLEKIKQQKVELKSSLIRMLACKLSPRIFFVCKNSILTYTYQAQVKDDKYNKLQKGKHSLKCELDIKTAVLNNNETFLAVLVAPGPLQNAKIEIYNLAAQQGQFYAQYKIQQNLPASIDVIDFCTDHEYLVYQGTDEQQTIIDLMTKQKIKAGTLQNPPQWNEEAKRTTPSIKQITTFYAEQNKLLKVVQVMNKGIIATDEMGSVRVFSYPITANKQQNYQVYIEHLNNIYLCVLSPDNHTLVTVSREDRAIHLWKVIHS